MEPTVKLIPTTDEENLCLVRQILHEPPLTDFDEARRIVLAQAPELPPNVADQIALRAAKRGEQTRTSLAAMTARARDAIQRSDVAFFKTRMHRENRIVRLCFFGLTGWKLPDTERAACMSLDRWYASLATKVPATSV